VGFDRDDPIWGSDHPYLGLVSRRDSAGISDNYFGQVFEVEEA
jgi:hypothetical protein